MFLRLRQEEQARTTWGCVRNCVRILAMKATIPDWPPLPDEPIGIDRARAYICWIRIHVQPALRDARDLLKARHPGVATETNAVTVEQLAFMPPMTHLGIGVVSANVSGGTCGRHGDASSIMGVDEALPEGRADWGQTWVWWLGCGLVHQPGSMAPWERPAWRTEHRLVPPTPDLTDAVVSPSAVYQGDTFM